MRHSRRVVLVGLVAALAGMLVSSWIINQLPPDSNETASAIASVVGSCLFVLALVTGTVALIAAVPNAVRAFWRDLRDDE